MKTTNLKRVHPQEMDAVRITEGGGMGGTCRRYCCSSPVSLSGDVISFTGWEIAEDRHRLIYLNEDNGCLFIFEVSHWPDHRIANLRRALDAGDMVAALAEYRATQANGLHERPGANT